MEKNKLQILNKTFLYVILELLYCIFMFSMMYFVCQYYRGNNGMDEFIFVTFFSALLGVNLLLGPVVGKVLNTINVSLYMIYFISQDIYYRAFNSYYRITTALSLKNEVADVGSSIDEFVDFSDILPLIIWIVGSIVLIFFIRKLWKTYDKKIRYKVYVGYIALALVMGGISYNSLNKFKEYINISKENTDVFLDYNTDYYVYKTIPTVNQFVEKFGLNTFLYRDATGLFLDAYDEYNYQEKIDIYLNEKAPVINKNEYTGIFKDKNILFVMAESFNDFVLDEELTPTLYKLKHEGINVKGFNTPMLSGSTSDSEFMANTSLVPKNDGMGVCYEYDENYYPTTLAKIFKNAGYTTLAVHNNYAQYYNRDKVFTNFGYDDFMESIDFGLEDACSDSSVMEVLKWIIADAKDYNLMTYWITYSGHQPYVLDSTGVDKEDVEKIKEKYPQLGERYVSYMAKNMDLDKSIASLMEACEENGTLDDLVIVFYGDHLAKGLTLKEDPSYYDFSNKKAYKEENYTDLFIYNTQIEHKEIEKPSTLLDLLPTIANMFELEYDEKTVLGRDIFDNDYQGFTFSNYDPWCTGNYCYDLNKDIFSNLKIGEKEAKDDITKYLEMMEVSKYILKLDYFK